MLQVLQYSHFHCLEMLTFEARSQVCPSICPFLNNNQQMVGEVSFID